MRTPRLLPVPNIFHLQNDVVLVGDQTVFQKRISTDLVGQGQKIVIEKERSSG